MKKQNQTSKNKISLKKAKLKNANKLNQIIKREFPYVKFGLEKIKEKIKSKNYLIIIATINNNFAGFGETEFFEKKARINCVYVEKKFRRKGIAIKIIKKMLKECEKRGIEKVFLLVSIDNIAAKKLYEKIGFEFEEIYDKKIEGKTIEVWSLQKK